MQYAYIILTLLFIGILINVFRNIDKKDKPAEENIAEFHVFPDYPKSNPYECRGGDKLRFVVRGFTDKKGMEEVFIDGKEVTWKHTESNGVFVKGFTGDFIDYITPDLNLINDNKNIKEKLIFVSAHYRNFTDATWIKVIK